MSACLLVARGSCLQKQEDNILKLTKSLLALAVLPMFASADDLSQTQNHTIQPQIVGGVTADHVTGNSTPKLLVVMVTDHIVGPVISGMVTS